MDFVSHSATRPGFLRFRLRLVDFLVRMWLLKALLLLIFPDPVVLNLFAAPRLVFILGMTGTP